MKTVEETRMHCPNCGAMLAAEKRTDGALRIDCPRCKVKIFSKHKGNREVDMKIRMPP